MRASSSFLSSPTADDTAARRPKKNDQSKVFVFFSFPTLLLGRKRADFRRQSAKRC